MPGKGPGAAARRRSVSISVESVLEARIPLTTPRLVSRFLDERHSETPSSNSGAVVAAEFQELPDLQGLRSSLSCSPDLKSVSPPPSPHPSLPFSCPEIHRSACPRSTHGAQRGETGQERDKHPQTLAPTSLGGAHPSPSRGWDLGQGLLGPARFEEAPGKAGGE